MNSPWKLLTTQRDGEPVLSSRMGLAASIATLAWSLSGSMADAQQQRTLQHDGHSFEVVSASDMSSVFEMSGGESVGSEFDRNFPLAQGSQFAGGQLASSSCGDGQCSGSCGGQCGDSACGVGGGYRGGLFGHSRNCGGPCNDCQPFCYGRVEAVYMQRDGLDNFTRARSPDLWLDDPGFEPAPRITIGTAPDCVSGCELSFTGPLNWEMNNTAVLKNGQTLLTERIELPGPGGIGTFQQDIAFTMLYDPTLTSPVDDANDPVLFQRQRYESTYWTVEASKTSMAWDIAKLLIGPRYIRFDEEYSYTASNGPAPDQNAAIYSEASNDLIGLQVGADIFSPICRSTSAYFRGRAGGYYNLAQSTAFVEDQATWLYGESDEDNGFAAMFELGGGLQYQICEMFSIHGGGELWYLTQVATAENQIPTVVGVNTPYRGTQSSDDVFFAGFNVGATMKY
ncbi:hypothetical protein [Allorhodopirellula solitaria]|uniref:Uncharacterized protein n=1 Tax=Allorhodopirellula solitaria TaxID=2527987 RepID=A0A5C5XUW5_9BACT|nr:hypothetical protein [Allorhodopirellula solitaria]TWT65382.1 hypothetical protein CA85_32960 [Allorhodopirellula solitaria]